MLIEFYGENFGCFKDEFHLSMLATEVDPNSDRGILEAELENEKEPLRLLRSVAIYGPNGSGKSTVLRAAHALRQLISETRANRLRSDSLLRPYEPFALETPTGKPVRLGIKAVIDRRVYDYEIQFDRTRFISERLVWLNASATSSLFHNGGHVVLFNRKDQEVEGEWKQSERFALLAKDFRPNALLLSLADRLAPSMAKNIAVGIRRLLTRFHSNQDDSAPPWLSELSWVAKRAREDSEFGSWLLTHLKSADLGVVNLKTEEGKVQVQVGPEETEIETFYQLTLVHRGTRGAFPIPYQRESHGTRKFVEFAPMLFGLSHGPKPHAVFADEIDEAIHPVLLQAMISHFNCEIPPQNARGQLIFVTHDTDLIDAEAKNATMRRDQIYLTEKDATGAARLYSVAEFNERNNLNLRRRYLQGRYGALPAVGTFEE